jgi:hypothetical protein
MGNPCDNNGECMSMNCAAAGPAANTCGPASGPGH